MKEDGFPETVREPKLVRGITTELRLDLDYKTNGEQGRGVYTKTGDLIANVDSYQNARERFPSCTISREKDRSNVLE